MNTRKLRKMILTLCSALLLVSLSVGITVAYLTAEDSVTNTFTVGKVEMTMDEAIVDEYGNPTGEDDPETPDVDESRTAANTYKLIPDHYYVKDPTIHLKDGSETSWLFAKVKNDLKDIEAPSTDEEGEEYLNIHDQIMDGKGWEVLVEYEDENTVIYYNSIPRTAPEDGEHVLFDCFKVAKDANLSNYVIAEGQNVISEMITVEAYAVQADGFDNAYEAWNSTFGASRPVPVPAD